MVAARQSDAEGRGGSLGVTTYHPDSLAQDVEVLRDIHRRFDGTLALNSAVLTPGAIRVGDRVHVLDGPGEDHMGR